MYGESCNSFMCTARILAVPIRFSFDTDHATSHLSIAYICISIAVRSHDWKGTNHIPDTKTWHNSPHVFLSLRPLQQHTLFNNEYVKILMPRETMLNIGSTLKPKCTCTCIP